MNSLTSALDQTDRAVFSPSLLIILWSLSLLFPHGIVSLHARTLGRHREVRVPHFLVVGSNCRSAQHPFILYIYLFLILLTDMSFRDMG